MQYWDLYSGLPILVLRVVPCHILWCCLLFVYHTVLTHETKTWVSGWGQTRAPSLESDESWHISGASVTQIIERLNFEKDNKS
jgi:hypothetical protein